MLRITDAKKGGLQMAKIISDRHSDDAWTLIRADAGSAAPALPDADCIFPLALWKARKQEIIARYKRIGLRLDSDEAVDAVADDLHYIQLVAIPLTGSADGRACEAARRLRDRHGYPGEVRAIGRVLEEQLFFLKRSGFDAFDLRTNPPAPAALPPVHQSPRRTGT